MTVTLTATDDLSGVNMTEYERVIHPDGPSIPAEVVEINSPSGGQSRDVPAPLTLTAGNTLNGTWQGSAYFPQYSEAGTWQITRVDMRDYAENYQDLTTANLTSLNLPTNSMNVPTNLIVIQPSLTADGTLGSAGGTVADSVFGSRAQITVPAGVFSGNTTIAIDVLTSPLAIPNPTGYSGPGTYFVNFQLTPTPSFPLPAPGVTLVLPLAHPQWYRAVASTFTKWTQSQVSSFRRSIPLVILSSEQWMPAD